MPHLELNGQLPDHSGSAAKLLCDRAKPVTRKQ
jgi:hypothetical protein